MHYSLFGIISLVIILPSMMVGCKTDTYGRELRVLFVNETNHHIECHMGHSGVFATKPYFEGFGDTARVILPPNSRVDVPIFYGFTLGLDERPTSDFHGCQFISTRIDRGDNFFIEYDNGEKCLVYDKKNGNYPNA